MKTIMKLNRSFYERMFCYIAGLLIMSVGSNLFLKAALGVAPSCTIALALSEIFPSLSYAVFNFLVNSFLLLCEIAVVRKIEKRQAVQLVLTFLYSLFIQWTACPLRFITADTMTARVGLSFIACAVLAAGISFTVNSGFAVLPLEGFVASLSEKTGKPFGTVRIYTEVSITVISGTVSIVCLGSISVVGIGTVIAAFCTGTITNLLSRFFTRGSLLSHAATA